MRWMNDAVDPALRTLRSAAFDLNYARELYRGQKELDDVLAKDRRVFEQAVNDLFEGKAPESIRNTLDLVSTGFLDQELNARTASAELGNLDQKELVQACRTRDLAALGLLSLGSNGVVRRDAWEAYFDHVVRVLGTGEPMVPLDGMGLPNYQPFGSRIDYDVKTDRKLYRESDVCKISIKNKGKAPIYVEMIALRPSGQMKQLTREPMLIDPGEEVKGSCPIGAGGGKASVIVYACEKKFECGELYTMPRDKDGYYGKGMVDRVIHRQFYRLPADKPDADRPEFDAGMMSKKTIEFATQD